MLTLTKVAPRPFLKKETEIVPLETSVFHWRNEIKPHPSIFSPLALARYVLCMLRRGRLIFISFFGSFSASGFSEQRIGLGRNQTL